MLDSTERTTANVERAASSQAAISVQKFPFTFETHVSTNSVGEGDSIRQTTKCEANKGNLIAVILLGIAFVVSCVVACYFVSR